MIEPTETERQEALEYLREKLSELIYYGQPYTERGKAIRAAIRTKFQKWSVAK